MYSEYFIILTALHKTKGMGIDMNVRSLFSLSYYKNNLKDYKNIIKIDYAFNASFRGQEELSRKFMRGYEWKTIKAYRKFQVNYNTIYRYYYAWKLHRLEQKTGISFENNINIGKGLIIGHWGKIVLNEKAEFGNQIFLTHGVTVGRDTRGKRKGVPKIGNRVCIRTNSTVVGNITVGDDVLIAPNTFVNFDVPSHSIVIGNPATIHHRNDATEGHLGIIEEKDNLSES